MVIEQLIDLFKVSKKASDFHWRRDQLHLDQIELQKAFKNLEQDVNYLLMTFRVNNHIKMKVINANSIKQLAWIFHPNTSRDDFMVITAIAEQTDARKLLISETLRLNQRNDIFESVFKQKELLRISLNLQSKSLAYISKLSEYQFKNRFLNYE